ncbi:putative F-box protein At1g47790, partial [Raphanus sativus]|uniref:F-box protein At1g47790 n=1 Tax=Raphanus sativus TaxID=3726 RepID=A0A9W3CAC1_RAPSA
HPQTPATATAVTPVRPLFRIRSIAGKHKVICVLSKKYSDKPLILTLDSQESWRTITKGRCPMHRPTGEYGRCFNGILYYKARLLGDGHDIIMSFDVKSEYFNPIKFPEEDRSRQLHMIPYKGRVALVTLTSNVVKLYILKDAHGNEWMSRFDLRLPCRRVGRNSIHFRGITDAGELIFAPYSFYQESYILYLDPRRHSTRKEFFGRGRCGIHSNHNKFTVEVFPNHIESLFSL